MNSEEIKREIRTLENQRYQAMINKDVATLEKLFDDGLVYTHSSAQVDSKAQYINFVKTGVFDYKKIECFDEVMQVYGDHTVVTSGRATIEVIARGTLKSLNNRFVTVWIKTIAGWRFAAWQSTPIPA